MPGPNPLRPTGNVTSLSPHSARQVQPGVHAPFLAGAHAHRISTFPSSRAFRIAVRSTHGQHTHAHGRRRIHNCVQNVLRIDKNRRPGRDNAHACRGAVCDNESKTDRTAEFGRACVWHGKDAHDAIRQPTTARSIRFTSLWAIMTEFGAGSFVTTSIVHARSAAKFEW